MMNWLYQILATASLWSAMAAGCWAQQADEGGPRDADWALPYVLVILCIGLGIASVCRPGKRDVLEMDN